MKKLLSMVLAAAVMCSTFIFVNADEAGTDNSTNQDVFTMNLDDPNFSVWAPAAKKSGATISFPAGQTDFSNGFTVANSDKKMYKKEGLNLNDGDLGTITKGYFILSDADKDKIDSDTLLKAPFIAQTSAGETILSTAVGETAAHVVGYRFRAPRAGKILVAANGQIKPNTAQYDNRKYNVNAYKDNTGSNSGAVNVLTDGGGANRDTRPAGHDFIINTYNVKKDQDIIFAVFRSNDTNITSGMAHVKWTPVVAYIDDLTCEDFALDKEGNVSFKSGNGGLTAKNVNLYIKGDDKASLNITNLTAGTAADGKMPYSAKVAEADKAKLLPGTTYCLQLVKNITYAEGKTHNLTTEALEITFEGKNVRFNAADYLLTPSNEYWHAYSTDYNNDFIKQSELTNYGKTYAGYYDGNVYISDAGSDDMTTTMPGFVGNNLMRIHEEKHSMARVLAKGFTAPYTGKIRLEQKNRYDGGSNKIVAGTKTTDGSMVVRIEKKPVGKNKEVIGEPIYLNTTNDGTAHFEPMDIYVNKGDTIYVETYTDKYVGQTNSYVHLNPVVTYIDVPAVESVEFMKGTGEDAAEITAVADLKNCTGVKLTVSNPSFSGTTHARAIAAFYGGDGGLIKAALSEDLNLTSEKSDKAIDVSGVPEGAVSAKIFIWSADANGNLEVKPLTNVLKEIK